MKKLRAIFFALAVTLAIALLPVRLSASRSFVAASSQYLTAGGIVTSGYPKTIAFWIKPSAFTSFPIFFSISNGSTGVTYCFVNAAVNNSPILVDGGGTAQVTSSTTLTIGSWNSVVCVYTSSTSLTIYVNGTKNTTAGGSGAWGFTGPTNSSIGGFWDGLAGRFVDGLITGFASWQAAFTDADEAAFRAGLSPLKIRSSVLTVYTPLVGGSLNFLLTATSWTDHSSTSSGDEPRIYR